MPTRPITRHLTRHLPPFLLGPRQVSHLGIDDGQVLPRLEAGQPTIDTVKVPLVRIDQNVAVGLRRVLQPPSSCRTTPSRKRSSTSRGNSPRPRWQVASASSRRPCRIWA